MNNAPARNQRIPQGTRPLKSVARILGAVLAAVVIGLVTILFLQTRLIFPGADTQGQTMAQFTPPAGCELVRAKTFGGHGEIAMLFAPSLTASGLVDKDAAHRPTMLFFYGNGMYLATALDDVYFIQRAGANVLAVELPGYGLSSGKPSEAGCYDAADTALAYAKSRADVDPNLIVSSGWSLGGAIAIDLASRKKLAGLATFSTFTSIADMAHMWFPILSPSVARPFLAAQFASESKIGRVTCQILLGHGRHDHTVPFAMSQRLRAAAKAPVTYIEFDSDHNDTFETGARIIAPALRAWLKSLPTGA